MRIKEVDPLENWAIWYVNCDRVNIGILPEKYYDIIEEGGGTLFQHNRKIKVWLLYR